MVPASMPSRLDFPSPLRPTMPIMSPVSTPRVTESKTMRVGYSRCRSSAPSRCAITPPSLVHRTGSDAHRVPERADRPGGPTSRADRPGGVGCEPFLRLRLGPVSVRDSDRSGLRSEEHTSELQSRFDLVCRLLLEKKKKKQVIRCDENIVSDLLQ